MGDNKWKEVTRKKHSSVFQRLNFPKLNNSKADDLMKISFTMYVPNFPSHLSVRELWNICSKARTLVDVYIAKHRNALWQMFGFCRYIKVSNQESLINSLSNMWIGKMRLYANITRFDRKLDGKPSHARVHVANPIHVSSKVTPKVDMASSYVIFARGSTQCESKIPNSAQVDVRVPSIILSQDKSNDFPLALLGFSKRLCIMSSHAQLIFVSIMVTLNNVIYSIRVRELCYWTPTFVGPDNDNDTDEENYVGKYDKNGEESFEDNDLESAADTMVDAEIDDFMKDQELRDKVQESDSPIHDDQNEKSFDSDPFELDHLIKKSDGLWIPENVQVKWIVVYAPQSLSCKITLWSTLSNLLANWNGISVVMGDFNEVRKEGERHGLVFYGRQARFFNDFITNNSLIDIPLGGVPDHRPILIKESIVDYGPTPFWFFHSWLEMDGFHDRVVQTWSNDGIVDGNGFIVFKKKVQNLKKPIGPFSTLDSLPFSSLSQVHHDYLEFPFSRDEIKRAVWECGGDRALGPDGFMFCFFTTFWDTIAEDMVRFVQEFSIFHEIPKGCNPSFIDLILKIPNSKFVSDIRLISLIMCQYKIIEYRQHHKELLVFKVDFEKAFDSLRWDFLDKVIEKIGFGASVGRDNMSISHLMYADDVIFFGECFGVDAAKELKKNMLSVNAAGERLSSSSESLDQIHDRLQKLVSQLEIHGVSLSQEDVNLKFLRSLPSKWKTHTLIWRNKTDLEEQSLDDLFNSLKIYEDEVKSSSSAGTTTQNIAFVSSSNTDSTTEPVSAAVSVSAVYAKMLVSSLPNVDSLSNDVIYSFFASQYSSPQSDNEDLRRLMLMILKSWTSNGRWPCGVLQLPQEGTFAKECRSPIDSRRNGAAEPQRRNVPFESSTSNALVTLRQKLEKAEQERDDLKLKLEKFQTSFKNLTELLASQTNEKTGLGYNSQVLTRAMFDCDDYLSLESDESWPPISLYDRFQPSDGYHAVPLPYTGTFMPPKPDLVFNIAPTAVETDHSPFNVQLSPTKPDQDLSHTNRPTTPIIEDWVSDSEDESETKAPQIVPSFV
nr:hypothetical protein [Tanacetum cinerariifolium]